MHDAEYQMFLKPESSKLVCVCGGTVCGGLLPRASRSRSALVCAALHRAARPAGGGRAPAGPSPRRWVRPPRASPARRPARSTAAGRGCSTRPAPTACCPAAASRGGRPGCRGGSGPAESRPGGPPSSLSIPASPARGSPVRCWAPMRGAFERWRSSAGGVESRAAPHGRAAACTLAPRARTAQPSSGGALLTEVRPARLAHVSVSPLSLAFASLFLTLCERDALA